MNDDMEMDNATDFTSQMMSIAGHSFQICRMKLDAESSAILSAACGASHPELIDDDRVDQIVHPVGPATFGNLWTVEFLISQCAAPVRYLLGHGPWQTILHSGSELTVHRPVRANDQLDVSCTISHIEQRRAGVSVTFLFTYEDHGGQKVLTSSQAQYFLGWQLPDDISIKVAQGRTKDRSAPMDYSQKAPLIFDGAVCHTFEAGTGYLGMAGNFLEPPLRLGSGIPDFVNAHLSTKESKRIGLNARNVTGMCSVARVVVELVKIAGRSWHDVTKIRANFAAPIEINRNCDDVALSIHYSNADSHEYFFELVKPGVDGAKDTVVIRNGYIAF